MQRPTYSRGELTTLVFATLSLAAIVLAGCADTGSAVLSADPGFITFSDDGDLSNDDLSPSASSPCVDTGINSAVFGVVSDFEATARPADGNGNGNARFDMGAYERP